MTQGCVNSKTGHQFTCSICLNEWNELIEAIPKLRPEYSKTDVHRILIDQSGVASEVARKMLAEECHQALCVKAVSCTIRRSANLEVEYAYPLSPMGDSWIVGEGRDHQEAKFNAVLDWHSEEGK
jgi:hypothetical protein